MRRGWQYPFTPRAWDDIVHHWDELPETFGFMADLARSIRDSHVADELAGATSMHDLVVAVAPATEPPFEVLRIRGSSRPGFVRIEHESLTGHDDAVERPVADVLPLFWRFVTYKFGLDVAQSETGDDSE